jgi:transcriptional regulator with XRE-family HTH domain
MSDHAERFAENLRRLRRRAAISAEDLADRTQIHRNHIGSIENGHVEPRLGTLIRDAAAKLDRGRCRVCAGSQPQPF